MQVKTIIKRNYRSSIILSTSILLLSSCQMVNQSLFTKSYTEPHIAEQPVFIEDFYPDDAIAATRDSKLKSRAELRITDDENVCYAQTRNTYIFTDEELAGISDIGGEELNADSVSGIGFDAGGDAIISKELFDLGATYADKFDPLKLDGKLLVDVTMDDMSCFTMPVLGKTNSKFGWRRGRVHSGIDLDLETGDAVVAAIDGVVTKAQYTGGYGNLVVLQHDNGLETYYAHLSKIKVEPGQKLESGDVLGLGGSTGRSTGPHLHFEIRYRGAAFDPSYLVDFDAKQLRTTDLVLEKSTFKVINDKASTAYYTVRKGDTLSKIAVKNGTSVSKICKMNGISSTKIIKPGMRLRIR